jgi:chromosome partitioning protein
MIDTAAGVGTLSRAVYAGSSHLLLPQQAEPLGLRSLPTLMQALMRLREQGASFEVLGILLTMFKAGSPPSESAASELRQLAPPEMVLQTMIPRDDDILRASEKGLPVAMLHQNPPAVAATFDQLAAELEPRLGLTNQPYDDDATGFMD